MEEDLLEDILERNEEFIDNINLNNISNTLLDSGTVNKALQHWIKDIQSVIHADTKYSQLSQWLTTLVDTDGIICCEGRLPNGDLPWESKYSMLLPRHSLFVLLLIH